MRLLHLQLLTSAAVFAANKDQGSAPPPAEAPPASADDAPTAEPEGVRARRAIMLKQFLPSEGIDWILKNVVAQGKGTKATLGRVFGICTGYEVRNNTLPDGTPMESIALKGAFNTESYITGELGEGTLAFIPAAYSEKVKAIFDSGERRDGEGVFLGNDVRMIEVDLDIGVEATGKSIPYEWVIIAYREGEEMAVLKKMRQSRARPAFVLQTGAVQIEAKARPAPTPILALASPEPTSETVSETEGEKVPA